MESLQRAAQASLEWFESAERYHDTEPLQFAFNLLTRSLRITHENLRLRDPALVAQVDRWFAEQAGEQSGRPVPLDPCPPPLFTPYRLRELVLPNRIVVSSMCQYRAEDGLPNDWHLVHLGSRAIGGAGLVMTEMTDVSREGRISPGCAGMYLPAHVAGWQRIVEFVHRESEAKIGIQLSHAGRKGSTCVLWEGEDEPLPEGNWPLIAPSPIPYRPHNQTPREMTRADMDQVAADFVRATGDGRRRRVRPARAAPGARVPAGLVHLAAHQPANRRVWRVAGQPDALSAGDRDAGSAPSGPRPSRCRSGSRRWTGRPAAWRRTTRWRWPGWWSPPAPISWTSPRGRPCPRRKPVYGRQFQTPFSDRIRHEARVPTMTVGNISSAADVNTILAAGRADLVVLARAHLWDPYWTRHAAADLGYTLPWPPAYATLNRYTPRLR